jgi:molybdopterin-guanine dinucleotide biosynthesis protein A
MIQQESAIRNPQSAIRCFVQAGGRSSRMGRDKAFLEVGGTPIIERVLFAAQSVVKSLAIIINAANPNRDCYEKLVDKWNVRLLYDLHDHQGPLGGIHTSLVNCAEEEPALILACDLPFLTTQFLLFLTQIHQHDNHQSITLPVDQEGRLQPLAGIYSATCLPAVERLLAQNILRVDRICSQVITRQIAFKEFASLPGAQKFFLNVNTADDYQSVR